MNHTVYIENLGCAKNQVDAEVMIESLTQAGWSVETEPERASVIVVNSCGFIEPAKEESIDTAFSFHSLYPDKKIVMAGCLAQRYGAEIHHSMPELAAIFGNRAPQEVPEFLEKVLSGEATIYLPEPKDVLPLRRALLSYPGSAFVKVAEGCNNRCTFCAIPLIRGGLRSRTVDEVMAEITHFLSRGIFEINLVSQDLAAYGRDRGAGRGAGGGAGPGENSGAVEELLSRISALPGDFWIRLLYIYPEHFPDSVLQACRRDPRILPYFDIPMQHASRQVLAAMGRPGDGERYLQLVRKIRDALPDAVIRSTFLVGFPGETDADMEILSRFQAEAEIDWLGVFPYSPEDGTAAYQKANGPLRVAKKKAEARKKAVEMAQIDISARRLDRFIGKTLRVLVEERVEGEPFAIGRAYLHAPEVDGLVVIRTGDADAADAADAEAPEARGAAASAAGPSVTPGRTVDVRIIRRNGVDLEGVPVTRGGGPGEDPRRGSAR